MKRYIKSSNTDDVFMLMGYWADVGPDTTGMDGDDFDCYGKFFAPDLATAKRELEIIKKKYPWIDGSDNSNIVHQVYVDNYNEYFDSEPQSESDIDMNPSAWGGVKYNVFSSLEALIEYLGWDRPRSSNYSEDDELPFTI